MDDLSNHFTCLLVSERWLEAPRAPYFSSFFENSLRVSYFIMYGAELVSCAWQNQKHVRERQGFGFVWDSGVMAVLGDSLEMGLRFSGGCYSWGGFIFSFAESSPSPPFSCIVPSLLL